MGFIPSSDAGSDGSANVRLGFDHPAFTDWVWPEAAEQGDTDGALSATQLTAGDNE